MYDRRHLPAKQKYLQCVLGMSDLFKKGNRSFRSDHPQSYYNLLLCSPGAVAMPGRKVVAKDCAEQVKRMGSELRCVASLSSCAPVPIACVADANIDGEDEPRVIVAAPVQPPHPPPLALVAVPASPALGVAAASELMSPPPLVDAVDGEDEDVPIDAFMVENIVWARPEGKSRGDRGYRLTCPFHPGVCGRPWRSLATDRDVFGEHSCRYFRLLDQSWS